MTDNGIKSLRWLIFNFPKFENPKDDAEKISNCIHLHCQNVVDELNRQRAKIEDLTYKLVGVMHSVDKWLDGDELKQDEVNRAATMREKTLRITEKQRAEIENLQHYKSLYEELKAEHLETVRLIKTAETEAVKRFARKLVALDDIEKITKEMVGDGDA